MIIISKMLKCSRILLPFTILFVIWHAGQIINPIILEKMTRYAAPNAPKVDFLASRAVSRRFVLSSPRAGRSVVNCSVAELIHFSTDETFVATNFVVHHFFDACEFGTADRLKMREIETQAIRRDQRTFLADVLAKNAA